MRVDYFEGFTYDGAAYCISHLPADVDPEEVRPIFAGDEWDSYPCCDTCQRVFDYVTLTADGEAWLRDSKFRRIENLLVNSWLTLGDVAATLERIGRIDLYDAVQIAINHIATIKDELLPEVEV